MTDGHIYTCGPTQKVSETKGRSCDKCSGQILHLKVYLEGNKSVTKGMCDCPSCAMLLFLPFCSTVQTLPSSAWERQMRSKNHRGATQSPMSSSHFSLLSQLFVTPVFLRFFPLAAPLTAWMRGGTSLLHFPAARCSPFACCSRSFIHRSAQRYRPPTRGKKPSSAQHFYIVIGQMLE